MSSLLEVRNLSTRFTSDDKITEAVDDISFSLNHSETIGIVGESGSGKSVTSLSIMRLVPRPGKIIRGEIIFSSPQPFPKFKPLEKVSPDVNLLSLPEKEMRRYRGKEIAMIFQEPMTSLNPVFNCGSQVAEAIRLHLKTSKREAKDRTLALFGKVKLSDPLRIFNSYPHQLSGGQKQRVMIAMAMSCSPSILIADEPTTALDVTVQAHILELMEELRQENNMAMIFITHDLGVVAEVADRVLVMYRGKIVEQGSVEQIFSDPGHPYTKGLLACRPPLSKKLKRLPVISDFMMEENGELIELRASIQQVNWVNEVSKEESSQRLNQLLQKSPLLQVKSLSVYFPSKKTFLGNVRSWIKAVDDVSFQVHEGETLGLVGESGCGKTTLGKAILQLIKPSSGEVIFHTESGGEEKNLVTLDEGELRRMRRHIQIIFQDPYSSLNPRLTIGYAIIEPMKVHKLYDNDKVRREKAMELLQKVNMPPDSFNRFPHEFSGGQRQRICIARALSVNPRFMICDECVSALDVSVQAQVLNLLTQLREEFHFTYIFISHDLSVVKFMSDSIMVMNAGKIEEMGPADEIYYHPSSEYTKKLIAAIPKGIPGRKLEAASKSSR
ncbi:MAG TPA: ABC transporter ATP-binding protein [Chitinophagales bacterium]|nr:ABC transporter ATP-binding protein [Chitinophagales bacterium]